MAEGDWVTMLSKIEAKIRAADFCAENKSLQSQDLTLLKEMATFTFHCCYGTETKGK